MHQHRTANQLVGRLAPLAKKATEQELLGYVLNDLFLADLMREPRLDRRASVLKAVRTAWVRCETRAPITPMKARRRVVWDDIRTARLRQLAAQHPNNRSGNSAIARTMRLSYDHVRLKRRQVDLGKPAATTVYFAKAA
jgi:hypothetical protein